MGDMVISVTCPDGTSVILHDQGGGGTLLGEPVDVSSPASLDPPGIGYDYSWSPYSTAGTWVAASSGGGFGTPLPPGDYESVFSLDSLVGCPLNGTWSFEICDLLGSDDGWVSGWGLDFNPALYPDITEYTPIYGADADSTIGQPLMLLPMLLSHLYPPMLISFVPLQLRLEFIHFSIMRPMTLVVHMIPLSH